MGEVTLSGLLSSLQTIFTAIIGYFGDVLDLFITHPLLLLMFGVSFVSIIIHMGRSLAGR